MNNKVYTQIQSKMNQLQKNKTAIIDSFRSKLKEHEDRLKEANLHTTVTSADADVFVDAMLEKDRTQYYIDYFTDKIRLVEKESLLSDKEYDSDVKAIRSEQKKITDASFKKIVKLLNEVFSIYDELFDDIGDFNNLIRELNLASNKPDDIVLFKDDAYTFIHTNVGQLEAELAHNPKYADCFKNHK